MLVLAAFWGNGKTPAQAGKSLQKQDSGAGKNATCSLVELIGEVSGKQIWSAAIGEGWFFRLLPIVSSPSGRSYSGWDLVVDRKGPAAGFPDALLLATPPYGSLNEREIGTTFGLRAQDALGWEPRHFRFLTTESDLLRGRELFKKFMNRRRSGERTKEQEEAGLELIQLSETSSTGRFEILDAHLVPGNADPLPFAQQWGAKFKNVPHTVDAVGAESRDARQESGDIRSMKFRVTLWLPEAWDRDHYRSSKRVKCAE